MIDIQLQPFSKREGQSHKEPPTCRAGATFARGVVPVDRALQGELQAVEDPFARGQQQSRLRHESDAGRHTVDDLRRASQALALRVANGDKGPLVANLLDPWIP